MFRCRRYLHYFDKDTSINLKVLVERYMHHYTINYKIFVCCDVILNESLCICHTHPFWNLCYISKVKMALPINRNIFIFWKCDRHLNSYHDCVWSLKILKIVCHIIWESNHAFIMFWRGPLGMHNILKLICCHQTVAITGNIIIFPIRLFFWNILDQEVLYFYASTQTLALTNQTTSNRR